MNLLELAYLRASGAPIIACAIITGASIAETFEALASMARDCPETSARLIAEHWRLTCAVEWSEELTIAVGK